MTSSIQNTDYSNRAKLLKCDMPILFFSMQLDNNLSTIPGCNEGRLFLYDYNLGYIHRWVATSSYDGRQRTGDWDKTGGIHPPNSHMSGADWFYMDMKLIVQPGQPVDEGYLPFYRKSNNWRTVGGANRSQIMFHADENYQSAEGSYGCIVMKPKEWEDFKTVIRATCGHLKEVRYGVGYTFQV